MFNKNLVWNIFHSFPMLKVFLLFFLTLYIKCLFSKWNLFNCIFNETDFFKQRWRTFYKPKEQKIGTKNFDSTRKRLMTLKSLVSFLCILLVMLLFIANLFYSPFRVSQNRMF
jgi:hypothetical protein